MVLVNQLRVTNVIARRCVYKSSTTGLLWTIQMQMKTVRYVEDESHS